MSSNPTTAPSFGSLLLICCLVVFGCYFGTYMRLPVVPLYALSLGADPVQVGIINAAFLFSAGTLSLPLGMLSDRLGIKFLAAVGLLILSASSFLLCLSRTPGEITWIYLFSGVGLAAFGPTVMALVANFSPATHLGRAYGWYTTALYTGMSIGPALGGFVAQGWGFPRVFFISGISTLLTFGVLAIFLPRARPVLPPGGGTREIAGSPLKHLLHNRPLWGCWLATLGGCFGLGMFLTFLPLHAHNQGLTLRQIGLVFATQGIINALSRFPFGHWSDRAGSRRGLVVAGLLGVAASLAGFGISRSPAHFILCAVAIGASMGLAFTSIGALIAETVPPDSRGMAMGGYNSCIYLGMMLSSAMMGPMITITGFPQSFLITGVISGSLTFVFYLLMKGFTPPAAPPCKR